LTPFLLQVLIKSIVAGFSFYARQHVVLNAYYLP